jgi:hypothetical protein
LQKLLNFLKKKGRPVYGLSFHVDYWNYIGWRDPYSKAEYTSRQRKYAQMMNSEGVYTPQMIVNGEVELVGSNKAESNRTVASALAKEMEYQVSLNSVDCKEEKIIVAYSLSKSPTDLCINVAIVERKIENEVLRGENAGRTLAHRNVVRSFISKEAKKEASIEIEFPKKLSTSSLIVFIQDQHGHILGATGRNLN